MPPLIALGLVTWVLFRIDRRQLLSALQQGDYLGLVLFTLVFVPCLLLADSAATKQAYRAIICDIPYKELVTLRAASYLPSMVNHHVGQAWLTYFFSRVYNAPIWRMAGATLFVYATTFACVILVSAMALPRAAGRVGWLLPTLGVLGVAGLGYLVLLQSKPKALVRLQLFAPLFEMEPQGHLLHALYRLPHVLVLFVGTWVPFFFFGVDIPLADALVIIPVLMLVVALPVAPQGIGTRDVVALQLLGVYVPQAGQGAIAAATLSFAGTLTLAEIVVSIAALAPARALLRRAELVPPADHAPQSGGGERASK